MPAQTVIKVRRDSAANWISADPTLASGEIGFETDTNQIKIGNGTDAWTDLEYASGGASVEISETAPATPDAGNVWFNSTDGRAYIYYDSTWVDLNPGIAGPAGATGATGPAGPGILPSATAPVDTTLVWYNTENGNAYTYYDGFWTSISGLPSIPAGGTTGQILAKTTSADYATQWVAPSVEFIKSQTIGTAVSSVTVTGAFSATYDQYKIVLSGGTASGNLSLNMKLGAASNGHNTQIFFSQWTSTTGSPTLNGGANAANFTFIGSTRTTGLQLSLDVLNPFAATQTHVWGPGDSNGSTACLFNGLQTGNTSFTDFTISTVSGTMTGGNIAVYGYRKV